MVARDNVVNPPWSGYAVNRIVGCCEVLLEYGASRRLMCAGRLRAIAEASRDPVAFCGRASVTDAYPGPATEVDVEWDNFRPSWV